MIGDLVPTGYVFHHIPRETRGGGVGIMLKRSLDAEIRHTGTSYTSFEAIGVHLKVLQGIFTFWLSIALLRPLVSTR